MKYQAAVLELSQEEIKLLNAIDRSHTLGVALQDRARIALDAGAGMTNQQIAEQRGIEEHRVARWRNRWKAQHELWKKSDRELRPPMSDKLVREWLSNTKGRGRKPEITEEQKALILAVACEPPGNSGYPHTHWTARLLAKEVIRRGIVETISHVWIWDFLKSTRPETAQKRLLVERKD
jgi:transposase